MQHLTNPLGSGADTATARTTDAKKLNQSSKYWSASDEYNPKLTPRYANTVGSNWTMSLRTQL